VNSNTISTALSAFVRSIRADQTKFDFFLSGQPSLNGLEMQGRSLFFGKYNCNSCHKSDSSGSGYTTAQGVPVQFVNIGLDANSIDNGRGNVTHDAADNGKFKIPSLKNVMLTAPYMHDGRFTTLDQVLDHYSHGIAGHPNLDSKLKNADGTPMQMNISSEEKTAIIAFLNTLTDYSMITDVRFSNPFKTH
jgi:cytochrome c peroxidase